MSWSRIWTSDARVGPKLGPIGPYRWQTCSPRQNLLKLILKTPRFVQFGANLTQFEANPDIHNLNCHGDQGPGVSDLGLKWVRLVPKIRNFFGSTFSTFWLSLFWKKVTELSHKGPIWPNLCPSPATLMKTCVAMTAAVCWSRRRSSWRRSSYRGGCHQRPLIPVSRSGFRLVEE